MSLPSPGPKALLPRFPITLLVLLALAAMAASGSAAAPRAPGNLKASMTFPKASPTGASAYHTYLFEWEDRSGDEFAFELFARVGSTAAFVSLGTVAANSTVVTTNIVAFPAGTILQFQIRAVRAGQASGYSNIASVTIPQPGDFNAPTSLAATAGPRDNTHLTWVDNSEQEDYYVIEYKLSTESDSAWKFYSLPYFNIKQSDLNSGLDPGASYNFRVRGLQLPALARIDDPKTPDEKEESLAIDSVTKRLTIQTKFENSDSVTYDATRLTYTAPSNIVTYQIPTLNNPPSRFTGTAIDEDTIRLNWFDESDKEQGYEVQYRAGSTGTFTTQRYTAPDATSFEINTPPNTTLTWRGRAAYQLSDNSTIVTSPWSPEVTVTTPFVAPSGVVAKPNPDSDEVSLTWADNSKVESGYKIGVRPRGSTSEFSLSKTVAANTTSTTITGLTPGTTFEVIVAAYYTIDPNDPNNEVLSDFSAPAIVTTRNGFTNSLAELLGSGKPFSYQLTTTTSVPRLSWSVEGLPPGLSFNPADGKITGVATRNGVFPVSLRAVYADGSTAGATLTLTVRAAVAPASPLSIPAGDRSVVAGSQTSIPLSGLFSDPDTETAVRLSTSVGNIDILLFPSATPLTVANFLSYVDAGYYNGVAFHRSVPGFVIQGGAYKPVEAPDKFQTIPKLTSPLNEPGITNVAKTIAMAKQEGNANSATSEFFFNLGNNAANLDSQNGGFTAFARVSDSTWGVVEAMALKPTSPYAYALDDITTADVTYSPVAASDDFPWPMNPQAGDTGFPSFPPQMDNTRTVVINSASRIQQVLSYSVTGNSNPDGVTASISDGNLLISGPLADAQSNLTIEATDLDGLKVSQTFTVRVVASHSAPTITQPPANATATLGGGATFTVTATGSDPLTYQWRKDGINLSGKTGASLPLSNLTYADAGAYSVVVRNSAGSATSSSASLTISGPPTISQQPSDLFRGYGYSATFTVKVAGPGPFTYQWFRGATSVSLTQNSASSTATYPIPAVDISHDGLYRVVITNSLGSTTSTPARLLVVPTDLDANGSLDLRDSDGDGFDDDAEIAFGGDPLSRTRKPATVFVARANALTTLKNLPLRRVPATPNATTFTHSLTGTAAEVPAFWLATQELSNSQFASILQIAYAQGGISIGSEDRPVVTYQGMPVCRLPTYASTDPNGLKVNEVSFDPRGGFYVPIEAANYPVRGVSWYGSFLCAVLMDDIYGLPGRLNIPTWSYAANPGEGFVIPSDAQWEWAAKSGIKNLPYPTGTSVSAALANFASPAGSTKPVNSYAANAFGLFNLAGNVAEWVFDTAEGGDLAYTRGGSWSDLALALSNDQRASRTKASTNLPTGVRLALVDDRSPSFTTSPKHQLVSSTGPLTLSAAVSGAPVLTGQWFKNNRPITGATAPVFTIPSPKLSDAGTYKVTVTNPLNSVTSAEVQAAVIDVPLAPQAVASAIGKPITFRIPHAGQNLAFQWKKDGTDIANGSTYKIERTATFQGSASLTVLSPTLDSGGRYTCVVSQPLLSPAPAPLTITFDLTVEAPPSFAAALPPTTILNATYEYTIPIDTHPLRKPLSVVVSGLPTGLKYDPVTGKITGIPARSGVFTIFATASTLSGTSTMSYSLLVQSLNTQTVGDFSALISRDPETNGNLGGRVDLKTTASGGYSGTLFLGGSSYGFSGVLNATVNSASGARSGGNATFTKQIARPGLPPVELTLTLNSANNLITGTLRKVVVPAPSSPPAPATVSGWRKSFSTSAPPTSRLGRHNFRLDIPQTFDGNPDVPQGLGYGWVQVTSDGMATVTGKLSDGSDFSSSAPLGPDGQVLIFRSLYTNFGSVTGTMQVANDAAHSLTGAPTWTKAQRLADRLYPNGIGLDPGPLTLTATGGLYTPPAAGKLVMGLPDIAPTATSEFIRLRFAEGGLNGLDVPSISIKPVAATTMPPVGTANPGAATLKIIPSTGFFSGTVTVQDSAGPRAEAYQGMIVKDQDGKQRGYGYVIVRQLPTGNQTLLTSRQLSGAVTLDEVPNP